MGLVCKYNFSTNGNGKARYDGRSALNGNDVLITLDESHDECPYVHESYDAAEISSEYSSHSRGDKDRSKRASAN